MILFEPDREDADMFFASIFSYSQRRRLCAAAYEKTRQNLRRACATCWRRSSRGTASRCATTGLPTRIAASTTRLPIRGRCMRSRAAA